MTVSPSLSTTVPLISTVCADSEIADTNSGIRIKINLFILFQNKFLRHFLSVRGSPRNTVSALEAAP